MAASGLLLFGFLLSHVGGNALLLVADEGETYDAYAARLRGMGPLLYLARGGLVLLFAVHITLALSLSSRNRRARGSRYRAPSASNQGAVSSRTMLVTGLIVAAFLVEHLGHFSFDHRFTLEGAALVRRTLQENGVALRYAVGVAFLWLHLWHAVPSALRTLGAVHARRNPMAHMASLVAVSAVCGLFLVILLWTRFSS